MKNLLPLRRSCFIILALISFATSRAATTYDVTSYLTLTVAITAAADGDTINFKDHIVVTTAVAVSKSLVFRGNGYTITVPVPGLSDAGIYNTSPSAFRVFTLSGAKTIEFYRLNIKGGSTTTSGAAISIASTTTAKFNYCTISNARCSVGGGGIFNQGNCYLFKSLLTRNVANYGGGMLNSGGKTFFEYATINENRTLTVNGGGGIETNTNGFLYVNNTSFSNNQSGAGGAINNYGSKAIVCNSSFTGNLAFNSTPLRGGAIYQDNLSNAANTLTLVNCLFAYNYYAPTGGYAASAYTLDDIRGVAGNIYLYYCTYTTNSASGGTFNYVVGNNTHALAGDGSNNDIFTGGSLSTPFDGTGVIQGTGLVFQPLLININGQRVPALKTGSYALTLGCAVGFSNGAGTPVIGYKNMSTAVWTDLAGTGASSYAITDDLTNMARPASPAVGAIQQIVDNYIILKVIASTGGTVSGASIYGEAYPSGTSITLTALPSVGYGLTNWTYNLGGTGTISGNPLTIAPTTNTTLTPNFSTTTSYTVTYLGNGSIAGTPPSIGTYASGNNATIAGNAGSLVKTGFTFNGWNTSDFGAGTSYAPGSTYTGNANMVLFASWASTGSVLKIDLISFTATAVNNNKAVLLSWETSSETNNDYFEVQSAAGCNDQWVTAGIVQGAGNSSATLHYSLADNHPAAGPSCYRLKQVDKDGKASYFRTVKINLDNNNAHQISLYPNPATSIVTLTAQSVDQKSIRVYNQSGQDITAQCKIQALAASTSYKIVVTNLPAGVYQVNTNAGSSRFVKMKE